MNKTYNVDFKNKKVLSVKSVANDTPSDKTMARMAAEIYNQTNCTVSRLGEGRYQLSFMDEETFEFETVTIRSAWDMHETCVGIHMHEADIDDVLDALETAFKDGFKTIYIYSMNKAG